MGGPAGDIGCEDGQLSVLALSSRFDGDVCHPFSPVDCGSFSTRSVESF